MVFKSKPKNRGPLFRVPEQKLDQLSYCAHTPKKMEAWIDALPRANLGETARLLYSGIQELNQLRIESSLRFKLLEVYRPAVYYLCGSLRKYYINQPIVLPEKAAKVANLAQALQTHLATGYKIVVTNNANRADSGESKQLVTKSIHRAITDMTSSLYRCYQLYFPAPQNLWSDLNKLYGLAEEYKLVKEKLVDDEAGGGLTPSITDVYLRACLLSTAKPNQLRQSEIALIYQLSAYLVKHISLASNGSKGQPFVVNLMSQQEPLYRSIAQKIRNTNNRYFECTSVMAEFNRLRESSESLKEVRIAKQASEELVSHLDQVWVGQKERTFDRTEQKGTIEIGVGLSVVHYFLSGCVEFEKTIKESGASQMMGQTGGGGNPFARGNQSGAGGDSQPFGSAGDVDVNVDQLSGKSAIFDSDSKKTKMEISECQLINTSPGGYCINLPDTAPGSIKTGELVVVREISGASWSLGVIRWAKRHTKDSIRIGVELMASQSSPVGVKVLHKTGDIGGYMRGLLLPELKALEQPMTVLVPNISFQEGSKVLLNQSGTEVKIQLQDLVAKTASFSQFELKILTPNHNLGVVDNQPVSTSQVGEKQDDDFDSIWSSL